MKLVKVVNNVSTEAAEAAGYWVMRLDSPSCRPADRAAFEAWRVEKPVHAKALPRHNGVLANVDRHLGSVELSALGEQVFEESRKQHRSLDPLLHSRVGSGMQLVGGCRALPADCRRTPCRSAGVDGCKHN